MTLRINNGILYKGNVKLLQATSPKYESLLEEILKANNDEEYTPQDLIYYPDSRAWATLTNRRAIFELTEESQADIVKKVLKPYVASSISTKKKSKTTEVEVDIPHPSPQLED